MSGENLGFEYVQREGADVLSIGAIGHSNVDLAASQMLPWCDTLFLKPKTGARVPFPMEMVSQIPLCAYKYRAVLLWKEAASHPVAAILDKIIAKHPGVLITSSLHGYDKSLSELFEYFGVNPRSYYMDYYNMWGPYYAQRCREVYGVSPVTKGICNIGSLRHAYLNRTYRWQPGKTNGRVLVIHEPVTSETWQSRFPIGDNQVSAAIIDSLNRARIPFDYKVHPNWPDFIGNTGQPMWRPPAGTNIVNVPLTDMVKYDCVVASWTSTQLDALAMGVPVVNVRYEYPTVNNSEWAPGKYGLLQAVEAADIPVAVGKVRAGEYRIDREKLAFFLGDLNAVETHFREFIDDRLRLRGTLHRTKQRFPTLVKKVGPQRALRSVARLLWRSVSPATN